MIPFFFFFSHYIFYLPIFCTYFYAAYPPFLFCVSYLLPVISFIVSFCRSMSRFSSLPLFQPLPLFLSFSSFSFCLALFLTVFLSAFLLFYSLVVFIPVSYSARSRWAVESHLFQKLSMLGEFYETQRYYVNRQLGIC
jgi:hypothetical protein